MKRLIVAAALALSACASNADLAKQSLVIGYTAHEVAGEAALAYNREGRFTASQWSAVQSCDRAVSGLLSEADAAVSEGDYSIAGLIARANAALRYMVAGASCEGIMK